MFEIENTSSFNSDKLTVGDEYDYVTRTSFNQGILRSTGFVNEENINSAGNWSLGLLQMDFFYRKKPWYAGQFVRKVHAKVKIPKNAIPFFTVVLNKQKPILLSVLVRDVDKTFCNTTISLPQTADGKIDFVFMENFIRELEEERIRELAAYLTVSGYSSYELLPAEQKALKMFEKWEWKEYRIGDLFGVNPYKKRFDANKVDVLEKGNFPYVVRTALNNGVKGYLNESEEFLNEGNTISFGQDTATMFYQEKPYFTGDKIKIFKPKHNFFNKKQAMYFITSMSKVFSSFSWGSARFNVDTINNQYIQLPVAADGSPDYEAMETLISAVQKLVIKDVVLYADRKIAAAKKATGRK